MGALFGTAVVVRRRPGSGRSGAACTLRRPTAAARLAVAASAVIGIVGMVAGPAAASPAPIWVTTPTPAVGGATPKLNGISCTGVWSCVAVGAVGGHPVADTLSNGTWKRATLALPPATKSATLAGVSCRTATSCVAVGSATTGNSVPLVETLTGGVWRPTELASPSNASGVALTGVSCPAAGSCVAVGWGKGAVDTQAAAFRLSGGKWTVLPLATRAASQLFAVSCPAVGTCVAAGDVSSATDPRITSSSVVDTLSGGAWKSTVLHVGHANGFYESLDSVSCPAVGRCVTVGNRGFVSGVAASTGTWVTTAWTLNGGKWSSAPVPFSSAHATHLGPVAVSCPAVGTCLAVGTSQTGSSTFAAVAAELVGSTWKLDTGPDPKGAAGSLAAASCANTSFCGAAGPTTTSLYSSTSAVTAPVATLGGVILSIVLGFVGVLVLRRRSSAPRAVRSTDADTRRR